MIREFGQEAILVDSPLLSSFKPNRERQGAADGRHDKRLRVAAIRVMIAVPAKRMEQLLSCHSILIIMDLIEAKAVLHWSSVD